MLVVAFGGWLIAASALGAPTHQAQPEQTQAAQPVQDAQPSVAPPLVELVKVTDASPHERPCKPGDDDRNSDLCAQWKAADAAAAAAKWAEVSAYIGGVAAFLLLWTLAYTARATAAADKAALAAQQACKITSDANNNGLRAYVLVDSARIFNLDTEVPQIVLTIRNFGQTPASDFRCQMNGCFSNYPAEFDFVDLSCDTEGSRALIGPGGQTKISWRPSRKMESIDLQALINHKAAFWAWGWIRYKDVFGKDQETSFRFMYGGDSPRDPDGFLAACFEGNHAT